MKRVRSFKGNLLKTPTGLENVGNIFFPSAYFFVVLSIFTEKKHFCASNLSSSEGASTLDFILLLKIKQTNNNNNNKTVGSWRLFGAFTTHASLVRDVTDTHCRAQNGSTHGRAFATFITE